MGGATLAETSAGGVAARESREILVRKEKKKREENKTIYSEK